jgi:hypothetical protein
MYSFMSQRDADRRQQIFDSIGKSINDNNTRVQSQQTSSSSQSPTQQFNLEDTQKFWDMGFDQRQREADRNAERAFKFRDLESIRNFGQEKDLSKQGFEQDRTIRGDELSSIERREAAQAQARERLADVNQRLQQRQQESERSAAMSAFRGGRR